MMVTLARPPPSRIAGMHASPIAGSPFGCVRIEYAATARTRTHANSGITWEPINSMVCITLSCGTLYGLNRQKTRSQPVAW